MDKFILKVNRRVPMLQYPVTCVSQNNNYIKKSTDPILCTHILFTFESNKNNWKTFSINSNVEMYTYSRKLRIENRKLVEVMAFDILTTVQIRY